MAQERAAAVSVAAQLIANGPGKAKVGRCPKCAVVFSAAETATEACCWHCGLDMQLTTD